VSVSDHQLHSSTTSYVVGWILLFSTLALFSTIVMMCGVPDFAADAPLITLGAVATWRYSWAVINLTRLVRNLLWMFRAASSSFNKRTEPSSA
jgi:hypothetical protein